MSRRINWITFLDEHRIPYVEQGPNVAQGNINIRCPWCGDDDPSEHLGISLTSGWWGCWRDASHRGKSPVRLIRALLGVSTETARRLAGMGAGADTQDIRGQVQEILKTGGKAPEKRLYQGTLEMPSSFRPIRRTETPLLKWLSRRRGFTLKPHGMCRHYDLRVCRVGEWGGRLIIPIRMHNELVTWTGRALSNEIVPRYKTLTEHPEDDKQLHAKRPIKSSLLNYDELRKGGHALVVTEGPFDALKMDWYGKEYGVRTTCLFNADLSTEQADLLYELKGRFTKMVLLLDQEFLTKAYRQATDNHGLFDKIGKLPRGVADPGDLTPAQVVEFCKELFDDP